MKRCLIALLLVIAATPALTSPASAATSRPVEGTSCPMFPASAFEAVDSSRLMLNANSGQSRQL